MNSVEFPAYVEVSIPPKTGKAIACWVGMALTIIIALAGIALGMTVSIFVFFLAYYLWRASKSAAVSHELKVVQASLIFADGQLELDLPAARLFDGRYVDQRYVADCSKGCALTIGDTGVAVLRAKCLLSFALSDGQVLDRREHEDGEVKLTLVSEEGKRDLARFIENNGL